MQMLTILIFDSGHWWFEAGPEIVSVGMQADEPAV